MVETRSQAQGKPLKKPGAYNTDLYYQEKDEGFGDVGVGQEPDAGTMDDPNDADFKVTGDDLKAAEEAVAMEDRENIGEDEMRAVPEEVADLKNMAATENVPTTTDEGEPVPIVETPDEDRDIVDAPDNRA